MLPWALISGGGDPGRFPVVSTPVVGNNTRQWIHGTLRNAQQGVVYPLWSVIWFVDGQGYQRAKGGVARQSGVAVKEVAGFSLMGGGKAAVY